MSCATSPQLRNARRELSARALRGAKPQEFFEARSRRRPRALSLHENWRLTSRSTAQRSGGRPCTSSRRRPLFRKLAACSTHTPARLQRTSRASAATHSWSHLRYAYGVTRKQPGESQHSRNLAQGTGSEEALMGCRLEGATRRVVQWSARREALPTGCCVLGTKDFVRGHRGGQFDFWRYCTTPASRALPPSTSIGS
jgi:hypothetical protein